LAELITRVTFQRTTNLSEFFTALSSTNSWKLKNALKIFEAMVIAKGKIVFFCFTMHPEQSNPPFRPLDVRDASWLLNLTPLFV